MAGARYGRDVKTLGQAWDEFRAKRSPKLIALGIVMTLAVRVVVGGAPTWRDLVAVAAMLVIYPFGEWAIHVYLLHLKPFKLRGQRVELATARAHREHHEQPNDLFMILLAALKILLHYYSKQEDMIVGTNVANRTRVETEGLIGFFVNQLVLRTSMAGNPSFKELLARVRQTTLEAHAHQDLPFEKLVVAVVELDREVHDQLVLGLGEDLPQVAGQVHEVSRLLELLLGHLVRIGFRRRRRCLQRIGHGLRVA